MSQENVEVVRRVNEAFNRADVAAMLECLDPDAVWWPRADDLEVESVRGHDAIAARFADMDASAKLRVELRECIYVGEFVVVAVTWLVVGAPAVRRSRNATPRPTECV